MSNPRKDCGHDITDPAIYYWRYKASTGARYRACRPCRNEKAAQVRAGLPPKIKPAKVPKVVAPKCAHDRTAPGAMYTQINVRTKKPYELCRECRSVRRAEKLAEDLMGIPAFMLTNAADLYPAWPSCSYLIAHEDRPTLATRAADRDALAIEADRATVIRMINRRPYPDDVKAELIALLTSDLLTVDRWEKTDA